MATHKVKSICKINHVDRWLKDVRKQNVPANYDDYIIVCEDNFCVVAPYGKAHEALERGAIKIDSEGYIHTVTDEFVVYGVSFHSHDNKIYIKGKYPQVKDKEIISLFMSGQDKDLIEQMIKGLYQNVSNKVTIRLLNNKIAEVHVNVI